jgi:hypothetical protein
MIVSELDFIVRSGEFTEESFQQQFYSVLSDITGTKSISYIGLLLSIRSGARRGTR